jgi:hypothetical protein
MIAALEAARANPRAKNGPRTLAASFNLQAFEVFPGQYLWVLCPIIGQNGVNFFWLRVNEHRSCRVYPAHGCSPVAEKLCDFKSYVFKYYSGKEKDLSEALLEKEQAEETAREGGDFQQ